MEFKVDVLFPGFAGKLDIGYLGWSTWAMIRDGLHTMVLDTGVAGIRGDCARLLAKRGVQLEDVDHVLITHMHYDHVANVQIYPNATYVCSRKEWEYVTTPLCKDPCVEFCAISCMKKKLLLVEDGEEFLPGIKALLTPGHTPGSCSYILEQNNGEKWIMAGDAAKNRGELKSGEVMMSKDSIQTKDSIKRIRETADRVLPGHDGWLRIESGKIIAEGGNDHEIRFTQGVTVNGGLDRISLHMD